MVDFSRDVTAVFKGGQGGGSSGGWCLSLRSFEMVQCLWYRRKVVCGWQRNLVPSYPQANRLNFAVLCFSQRLQKLEFFETDRFYLKICHGMFLTVALFLFTDGRNM